MFIARLRTETQGANRIVINPNCNLTINYLDTAGGRLSPLHLAFSAGLCLPSRKSVTIVYGRFQLSIKSMASERGFSSRVRLGQNCPTSIDIVSAVKQSTGCTR